MVYEGLKTSPGFSVLKEILIFDPHYENDPFCENAKRHVRRGRRRRSMKRVSNAIRE
jgi:hypothetical protein